MHPRSPVFSTILILVAALTTAPIVVLVATILRDLYYLNGTVNGGLAGIDNTYVPSALNSVSMASDQFFAGHIRLSPTRGTISVESFDPEAGTIGSELAEQRGIPEFEIVARSTISGNHWGQFVGERDRLWLVDNYDLVYERVNSQFIEQPSLPADINLRPGFWRPSNSGRFFVIDGKLHSIATVTSLERELFQLDEGKWRSLGEIRLLDSKRYQRSEQVRNLLGPEIQKQSYQLYASAQSLGLGSIKRRDLAALGTIEILPIGAEMHVFWRFPDRVLYRKGMGLAPPPPTTTDNSPVSSTDEPQVSALEPSNVDQVDHRLTLVLDGMTNDTEWYRVAVGGHPAVVLIDRSNPRRPRARALRLENDRWIEFASTELPFASFVTAACSRDDGSMAYLATATRIGRSQVLALGPNGFRLTKFDRSNVIRSVAGYIFLSTYFGFSLLMAATLALIATLLMWRDVARYEFGVQSVQLASIWERGTARIIDLILIASSAVVTFFVLNTLLKPDWYTFAEAIQYFDPVTHTRLRLLDHPSVAAPTKILASCFTMLIACWSTMVLLQGRYGLTPGKWLLGLRTIRATLRPCGFTHSLFRELLMCADCLNFICWTPGILFMAFTNHHQRIGDCLADTLVVRRDRLEHKK